MNFYAHAVLAAETLDADDHGFVFGAMLPDLAAMSGAPVPALGPSVTRGVAHHHEADARFHALPAFLELLGGGRARLEAAGLRRGVARACAHVGIELALDGALARTGRHREAFDAALAHGDALLDGGASGPLRDRVARLRTGRLPDAYADDAFVAARTLDALSGRPTLALHAGERTAAVAGLVELAALVRRRHRELFQPLVPPERPGGRPRRPAT